MPPIAKGDVDYVKEIIDSSRKQFSQPRVAVEARVTELMEEGREAPKKSEDKKPAQNSNSQNNNGKSNNNSGGQKFDKPKSNYDNNKPRENKPYTPTQAPAPTPNNRPMIDEKSRREIENTVKNQIPRKPRDEFPPMAETPLEEESLSLKNLETRRQVFQDPKKISDENKNSLKDALASILGNLPENKPEIKAENKAQNEEKNAPKLNEISSDELKDLLDVKQ